MDLFKEHIVNVLQTTCDDQSNIITNRSMSVDSTIELVKPCDFAADKSDVEASLTVCHSCTYKA